MGINSDRSLSGAVSDHELVSSEVDPPVLPAEVESHRRSQRAREKALTIERSIERLLLQACAVEVERYCDRMFWPGTAGAARASTAVKSSCDSPMYSVSYCPLYQDVSGVAAVTHVCEALGRSGVGDARGFRRLSDAPGQSHRCRSLRPV